MRRRLKKLKASAPASVSVTRSAPASRSFASSTNAFSAGVRKLLLSRMLSGGDSLQPLEGPVDPQDEGLGEWLAAADERDQGGAGDQVRDVVLAEVDEGEAEGQRVGPAGGTLGPTGLREEQCRH